MLRAQGIFRGSGAAAKVAFLYTGQGSQYVSMLAKLRAVEPIVAATFVEADRIMAPLLDKPLTAYLYPDAGDPAALARAEDDLRQTAITQPAVLATDIALTRLFASYGIVPDMVMGHSLGEYGALVAAGALRFADALEAVSARGREMTKVSMADNGKMAAVFAPIHEVERILRVVDGYVVLANVNSRTQSVIGGATAAVEAAMEHFRNSGYNAVPLPVSHAFHTEIVAPASGPLRDVLERLGVRSPRVPVIANVSGEFYPTGPGVETEMLDILAKQVSSPVQFVKGLESLHGAGARVYVEVGPKRALQGFVDDVLGERGVASLFTNHPKADDVVAFNQALCGLYAAGVGVGEDDAVATRAAGGAREELTGAPPAAPSPAPPVPVSPVAARPSASAAGSGAVATGDDARNLQLGRMFASFLEQAGRLYAGEAVATRAPVVVSGAALGLPGLPHVFDDGNLARLLHGQQLIDVIPTRFRRAILDKNVTRLVKSEESGAAFVRIDDPNDVIKLAARAGELDLEREFGVAAERIPALDVATRLAIGVGLDALRDAGIPLVQHYRTTHKGTQLPERWGLADSLRDDTGVIFASVFPGYDAFAADLAGYYEDRARRERLQLLESLAARTDGVTGVLQQEILRQLVEVRTELERAPYTFERQFLFRILAMGHSQLAELIGARGPNTQVNSACASTTQAMTLAEDWIRAGRCRRVLIVAADDATGEHLMEWIGAGFLASGAAATDDVVEDAALPFDRRRHGMILGMGAAALVVESADAARERGITPICEVLATATANSAFHGTRLDGSGRIVQLPELERMLVEALAAIRQQQLRRPPRERPMWNRVLLYVWPPLDLDRDELRALVRRLAPLTEGLGLEQVVVRARVPDPASGALEDRVLRVTSLGAQGGLDLAWDAPPTEPLRPLGAYEQKVLSLRRRGLAYPYEIVRALLVPDEETAPGMPHGEFVEYDLDDENRLVPVSRPHGQNTAHVVVGLIRNPTVKYPEGMQRVIVLGDPSKEMGSVAEPECRRIIEALALARRLRVPVEWFTLCAGAKIAMDSGTENMDWVSRVLRHLIEFTQAGHEVNVVVVGINVGAQPYWNAEATMLMHTRGILVMTPESAMVLTGKQALDYSGSVSAEDNEGIGGYERVMGQNGQAQYWAPDLGEACRILLRHYEHTYVVPGESGPRRASTTAPIDRDVRTSAHAAVADTGFVTIGDVVSEQRNAGRKKPFDIRSMMGAVVDRDHRALERWPDMRDAEIAVVWDAHVGGIPVCMIGMESHPVKRLGFVPADGPSQWTAGTLFPRSSKKIARTINSVSGNRPLVVLANLSGFDGSPDSMRNLQLEYGAEIGRAVVNFKGPIVFCVISRYHGGAFVVFSKALNEGFEAAALEGAYASVIGGAPAAAVVFARDVDARTHADPRIRALEEEIAAAPPERKAALRARLASTTGEVRSEKLGEVADEFDHVHTVQRALQVGSLDHIVPAARLRTYVIEALERGLARAAVEVGR